MFDDAYHFRGSCPENLLPYKYALPWLKGIHEEIESIKKEKSHISAYGTRNESEFLAVVAEYFFEQPQLMKKKHPIYTNH